MDVTSQYKGGLPPSGPASGGHAPLTSPGDIPVVAPPRRAAAIRRPLVVSAAAVCGVLAMIAAGRLTRLDDAIGWPYPAINAFTPLVYLPAYAAAAVAFAYRRNSLLLAAGVVVVVHLSWTVPELVGGDAQAAPAGAAPVRLMTANLNFANGGAGRLGAQIRTENPDVVVLEEVSELSLERLLSSGALDGYRHREVRRREDPFGSAVFSRFPLRDAEYSELAGTPLLRVTVTVDPDPNRGAAARGPAARGPDAARSFRLFAVHTLAPVSGTYTSRWRAQLAGLRTLADTERLPVVMAGDFNATADHRPFRRLLEDARLRDAHDAAGAGWTPTWHAESLLPRMLRLDHVLVSADFAATGHRVGDAFGSDHAPVTVNLALR